MKKISLKLSNIFHKIKLFSNAATLNHMTQKRQSGRSPQHTDHKLEMSVRHLNLITTKRFSNTHTHTNAAILKYKIVLHSKTSIKLSSTPKHMVNPKYKHFFSQVALKILKYKKFSIPPSTKNYFPTHIIFKIKWDLVRLQHLNFVIINLTKICYA